MRRSSVRVLLPTPELTWVQEKRFFASTDLDRDPIHEQVFFSSHTALREGCRQGVRRPLSAIAKTVPRHQWFKTVPRHQTFRQIACPPPSSTRKIPPNYGLQTVSFSVPAKLAQAAASLDPLVVQENAIEGRPHSAVIQGCHLSSATSTRTRWTALFPYPWAFHTGSHGWTFPAPSEACAVSA